MPHFTKPQFKMQNDPRQSAYGMMIANAINTGVLGKHFSKRFIAGTA